MCKCGDRQPVSIFEEPVHEEEEDPLEYFEPPVAEETPSIASVSMDQSFRTPSASPKAEDGVLRVIGDVLVPATPEEVPEVCCCPSMQTAVWSDEDDDMPDSDQVRRLLLLQRS